MTEPVRVRRHQEFESPARTSLDEDAWRIHTPASTESGTPSTSAETGIPTRTPDLPVPTTNGVTLGHNFGQIRVYETSMVGMGRAEAAGSSSQVTGAVAPYIQRESAAPAPTRAAKGSTNIGAVVRKSYTVDATTLEGAAAQIGKRAEAGSTEWKPTVKYTFDDNGTVTDATVDVTITVTMPDWPGAAKLNKAARAEWDRFVEALQKHEDGHVALAQTKLPGLGESLVGKSKIKAKAAFKAAIDDLRSASDAYDDKNDHGQKEGTVIDTGAGSPSTP